MGATWTFFRMHRWQRRALTFFVAVAVGVGAAVVLRPPIREYLLLRDLGSRDPTVREAAVNRGAYLGRLYPHVVTQLNEALGTADDPKFLAIARVLGALDAFRVAGRDPNQIDRLRLIEFLATRAPEPRPAESRPEESSTSASGAPKPDSLTKPTSKQSTTSATSRAATSTTTPAGSPTAVAADTRLLLFQEAVFAGRDNPYTRRLLAAAASDESPAVRQASAVLAARFADANTLRKPLDEPDPDPNVVEWAAIDAGLAGITLLGHDIYCRVFFSKNPAIVSGGALSLARLEPNRLGGLMRAKARDETMPGSQAFMERMYYVLAQTAATGAPFRPDANLSDETYFRGPLPPGALIAIGELGLRDKGEQIVKVLRDATADPNTFAPAQVLAALESAALLGLPVRKETDALLRVYWRPDLALMLTASARILGRQIDANQGPEANVPSPEHCADTLRLAALYPPQEGESNSPSPEFALALPSAAAAVALWLREPSASFVLGEAPPAGAEASAARQPSAPEQGTRFDANSAAFLVYVNSCREHQLPPDYISWHLARSGRPEAFELGMNLLPPPPDPRVPASRRGFRNYSASSRSTGAMLLALSARTPEQKKQAVERITSRLGGGPLGAPTDFYEIGTYRCALLILGQEQYRRHVESLLSSGAFPIRRALTALLAMASHDAAAGPARESSALAGRAGLDWLLWDLRASTDEIAAILIGTGMEEVLSVMVPELPAVDAAAGNDLRNWQVRIMQDYYRIHREKIRFTRP